MACKIIWSPASRDDLREIVRFIARDNPRRAESFGYELMRQTDMLEDHPEIGRRVPEHRDLQIREITSNVDLGKQWNQETRSAGSRGPDICSWGFVEID